MIEFCTINSFGAYRFQSIKYANEDMAPMARTLQPCRLSLHIPRPSLPLPHPPTPFPREAPIQLVLTGIYREDAA